MSGLKYSFSIDLIISLTIPTSFQQAFIHCVPNAADRLRYTEHWYYIIIFIYNSSKNWPTQTNILPTDDQE